jgi:hypothetical protein
MNAISKTTKNIWDVIFALDSHYFPLQRNYPREPRGELNPINGKITEKLCKRTLTFVRDNITDPFELFALDFELNYTIRAIADYILHVDAEEVDCFVDEIFPPLQDMMYNLDNIYRWDEEFLCVHDLTLEVELQTDERYHQKAWKAIFGKCLQLNNIAKLQQAVQYIIENSNWDWKIKAEGYLRAYSTRKFKNCDDEVIIYLMCKKDKIQDVSKEAKNRWSEYKKDWDNIYSEDTNPFYGRVKANGLRFAHWKCLDCFKYLGRKSENKHLLSSEYISDFSKVFSLFRTGMNFEPLHSKLQKVIKKIFEIVSGSYVFDYNYTVHDFFYLSSILFSFANYRVNDGIKIKHKSIQYCLKARDQIDIDDKFSTAMFLQKIPIMTLVALETHSLYYSKPKGWPDFIDKVEPWFYRMQSKYGYWYDGANNPDYTTVLILDALQLTTGELDTTFPITNSLPLDSRFNRKKKQHRYEIDYTTKRLIIKIGTQEKTIILKKKNWDFMCYMIKTRYDSIPFPRKSDGHDWKNQFDTLSKKVGGNELMNDIIESCGDSYLLKDHVHIDGFSQIGIRPTHHKLPYRKTVSLDSVPEIVDPRSYEQ